MELIRYLNANFFSQKQLLAVSGLGAAELADLQSRAMMPAPSYKLLTDVECESYFGHHAEQARVEYYAKGYASWIGSLQALASEADSMRVFSERYRARLHQLSQVGMSSAHVRFHAGLDEHLVEEWRHFLAGTYGLCTRTGLPEDIASKAVAAAIIEDIIENTSVQALTPRARVCLTLAVDLLDTASTQFAPHEKARSSRHRLIDTVRADYQL